MLNSILSTQTLILATALGVLASTPAAQAHSTTWEYSSGFSKDYTGGYTYAAYRPNSNARRSYCWLPNCGCYGYYSSVDLAWYYW